MFSSEKIKRALQALQDRDIDMWIVAGQESATNTEPVLELISDAEFIGYTALIFCKDHSSYAVCTPIDYNGYAVLNIFDEVVAFPVSFEPTLSEIIKKKNPDTIALNFSDRNPVANGLSTGTFERLKRAFDSAGFIGNIISSEDIVADIQSVET